MAPKFKTVPLADLEHSGISARPRMTKGGLAKEMGLADAEHLEYDGALPHDWLESMITFCKQSEKHHTVNHPLITSTTFWVYYQDDALGRPYSGCTEVQAAIDDYLAQEGL